MRYLSLSDPINDSAYGRRRQITILGLSFWWPFPVVAMLHSSSVVVFGWSVYGSNNCPRWIHKCHRLLTKLSDARYWVRDRIHPKHLYHIVRTELSPGYRDPDEVLLYAAMAVLGRYIEEMGGLAEIDRFNAELRQLEHYDVNAPGPAGSLENAQADRQEEAATIWRWWTVERPADQRRCEEMMCALYGDSRVSWKETENSYISEMIFKEFEGDEIDKEKEFRSLEKKIDHDEQIMLHRLIEIRHTLWT